MEGPILQNIRSIAVNLAKQCNSSTLTSPRIPVEAVERFIPDLNLPSICEILSPISKLDIPQDKVPLLMSKLGCKIGELHTQLISAYRNACHATSFFGNDIGIVQETYRSIYYKKHHPVINERVSLAALKILDYYQRISGSSKLRFNHKYRPYLEKYFELNAYPSKAHRAILARRTQMTPRQIEVWFQNHRNRSKKEKIRLHRLTTDLPLKRALAMLPDPVANSSVDPISDAEGHSMSDESDTSSQRKYMPPPSCLRVDNPEPDLFHPSHVFPSNVSISTYDPSSNDKDAFRFPPPVWFRKPSSASVITEVEIDMEEFISMFQSKLRFHDRRRRASPDPSDFHPWFSSTVTVLPTGSHEACEHGPIATSESMAAHMTRLQLQYPAGPGSFSTHCAFDAYVGQKALPFAYLPVGSVPVGSDHGMVPAWKPTSRSTSSSSEASSGNLSFSPSSSNSSPEPMTPPQLPESDISLDREFMSDEFTLDEFAPDNYDFSAFDFDFNLINHPDIQVGDYSSVSPVARYVSPLDKQTSITTVDPSLLTFSNFSQAYPNYLAVHS
ncbi:hypothetical protein CPC08DRAFT_814551 [Agrocybe pediades]|nr:hypothetical protein CPC08DRAFT_814551 [Agrocybe pediades]